MFNLALLCPLRAIDARLLEAGLVTFAGLAEGGIFALDGDDDVVQTTAIPIDKVLFVDGFLKQLKHQCPPSRLTSRSATPYTLLLTSAGSGASASTSKTGN